MKAKTRSVLLVGIALGIAVILFLNYFCGDSMRVEAWYSLDFYPVIAYIPKLLFGWIPFSIGDVLYGIMGISLFYLFVKIFIDLFYKQYTRSLKGLLYLTISLLFIYISFNGLWGINYYRVPVAKQLNLAVDTVLKEDHLLVLTKQIDLLNRLRDQLDVKTLDKQGSISELEIGRAHV